MSTSTPPPNQTLLLSHILTHPSFPTSRLPSLYSDFRHLRTNNPSGYTANTTAWAAALASAARSGILGDTFVVRVGEELVASLATSEWGRPLALGCVVEEVVGKREWYARKDWDEMVSSIYYRPWIRPWELVSWGLGAAGLRGRGVEGRGEFVVVKNVEDSAQKLLSQISLLPNGIPRLTTLPLLVSTYPNPLTGLPYTPTDLSVLTTFLTRDLRAATVSETTIKFADASKDPTPITANDHTIASLKTSISQLHSQIEHLSSQATLCTSKARDAVKSGNKILAMGALKRRKLLEETMERRVGAVTQLEEVLAKIEQAGDNAELVAQLKRSGKVLKALNKETGGVDAVDEVVDELREQMDEVEEVTRVLGGVVLEDGEVEEEMEELVKEEEERREKEREGRVVEGLAGLSLGGVEKELERQLEKEAESVKEGEKEKETEKKNEMEKKVAMPAE